MIQKLAIMVRQNVDWSSDSNTIKRELAFVEAYLSLQKYRFGERLSYQINAQEDCQNILVPKLTITTFVENACVHGIEAKSFPVGFLCACIQKTMRFAWKLKIPVAVWTRPR